MAKLVKRKDLARPPERARGLWDRDLEDLLEEGPALAEARRTEKTKIIRLAVRMAERIVHGQVDADPSRLDDIYRNALAAAGDAGPATIRVHPEDRTRCEVDALADRQGFAVVDDQSVGLSGCFVEACGVRVDARLEAALGALTRALHGEVGSDND